MISGWLVIVSVLLVTYAIEVVKGARTIDYLFLFVPVVVLPALLVFLIYLKKPEWRNLSYLIVAGYFIMYLFVMLTGSTNMVFSYILPMLSLLVLYHRPKLILATGLASLAVNVISIIQHYRTGVLTIASSKDAEIQIALIVLCFGGSYVAARLYDDITRQNEEYLRMLNEKNEQIQRMTMGTIQRLVRTMDAKDTYTDDHSLRVSEYSAQIARSLGMPEKEVENVRLVALLHDVGKIVVPDAVLNKPGRLTDDEFETMKKHTVIGSDIVKDIDMIDSIAVGARNHHERYDGKGYPDGLAGTEIPYIARIIAVADAYDAMSSDRVYRSHLTTEQVLEELRKGAGSQFDPAIAQTMIRLIESERLQAPSPTARNKPLAL